MKVRERTSRAAMAVTTRVSAAVLMGALALSPAAQAQTPSPNEAEQIKSRQRISTMEGALERAVSNGVENLLRQVRALMPEPPMLSGVPKVRGFRLDGYGVFFDVEVPALRLPLTWPLRYVIEDNQAAVAAALAEMRALVADQMPRERDRFELLARRLELRAVTPRVNPRDADPVVTDPDEAYTKAVREALIDAMIESSGPITIGPDEWLTVAARDNAPRDPLMPGDTAGLNTLLFRVRGADLVSFRGGRLTLDDMRRRVEVHEN